MPAAKICGLTAQIARDAALAGGARYLGFVFFPKSPRYVRPEIAADLAAPARGRADIAAVFADPTDAELERVAAALAPDWIQLHGAEPPARVAEARAFAKKGVIRALAVADGADLAAARDFEAVADMLLFDAKPPAGASRPGGYGAAFDWRILQGRRFARPWFLAGGLTPDNVAEAIRVSGAELVDASSGLESAPGVKDPARIAAFLQAVQQPAMERA
ncbi:MAG: phosphoribosylanthranilate isomerase [Hyphomonadaceae bacterium]|nr:phosphoribosylanthranilate isomerase [Hyphomonadaceae bacterium]